MMSSRRHPKINKCKVLPQDTVGVILMVVKVEEPHRVMAAEILMVAKAEELLMVEAHHQEVIMVVGEVHLVTEAEVE